MSATTTRFDKLDKAKCRRWRHRALWIIVALAVIAGLLWARGDLLIINGTERVADIYALPSEKARNLPISENKLSTAARERYSRDLTRGLELYTKGVYHLVDQRVFFRDLAPDAPSAQVLGYEYSYLGNLGYKEIPLSLRTYQITDDMLPYGYKFMPDVSDNGIPLDLGSSNYVLAHFYKPILGSSPIYAFAKIDNFNGIQDQEYARAYGKFDVWGIFKLEHD